VGEDWLGVGDELMVVVMRKLRCWMVAYLESAAWLGDVGSTCHVKE
jgi:hypothetical protein